MTRKTRRQKNREKNRREGMWMLAIFGTILLLCGVYIFGGFMPTHTEYSYDIKAEQVYDNDRINESVELQSLSEQEQTLLHDAFKKSDHFFGSSEVTVSQEEQFEVFDGWRVVEFQGVYILVAIDGPEEVVWPDGALAWLSLIAGIISLPITLVGLKMTLFPSSHRY